MPDLWDAFEVGELWWEAGGGGEEEEETQGKRLRVFSPATTQFLGARVRALQGGCQNQAKDFHCEGVRSAISSSMAISALCSKRSACPSSGDSRNFVRMQRS